MGEDHLLRAIATRYRGMPAEQRVAQVRLLARKSPDTRAFLKKFFPEMYKEAYPDNG